MLKFSCPYGLALEARESFEEDDVKIRGRTGGDERG